MQHMTETICEVDADFGNGVEDGGAKCLDKQNVFPPSQKPFLQSPHWHGCGSRCRPIFIKQAQQAMLLIPEPVVSLSITSIGLWSVIISATESASLTIY